MPWSYQLPNYPLHMLLLPNHAAVPDWWQDRPVPGPGMAGEWDCTPPPEEAERCPSGRTE